MIITSADAKQCRIRCVRSDDHKDLTLNEFKFIFWMEYGHRMLGRIVGLSKILARAHLDVTGVSFC